MPPNPPRRTFSGEETPAVKPNATCEDRLRALEMTSVQRGVRLHAAEDTLASHSVLHVHRSEVDRLEERIERFEREYVRNSRFDRQEEARTTQLSLEQEARKADEIRKQKEAETSKTRRFAIFMAVISLILSVAGKYVTDYWVAPKHSEKQQDVR